MKKFNSSAIPVHKTKIHFNMTIKTQLSDINMDFSKA